MAVQPQTPYIEHIANGTTTGFNLGFDCDDQDHLIVLVDDVEPVVGSWSLTSGAVVFGAAPTSGNKITIQRNTPFERKRDYQSYDNSFRPPAVNKDFDWIWLKLQELGVADWILGNRIAALKNYVDLKDDELRSYLMEEIRKQGVALDQLDEYYNYLMQRLAQIAVDKGWDASFVVDGDENQHQINDSTIYRCETLSDLKNIKPRKKNHTVYVCKHSIESKHVGGLLYRWVLGDADDDNGFETIASTVDASGRWKAIFDGVINAWSVGYYGDGTTDNSDVHKKVAKWMHENNESRTLIFSNGEFLFNNKFSNFYLVSNTKYKIKPTAKIKGGINFDDDGVNFCTQYNPTQPLINAELTGGGTFDMTDTGMQSTQYHVRILCYIPYPQSFRVHGLRFTGGDLTHTIVTGETNVWQDTRDVHIYDNTFDFNISENPLSKNSDYTCIYTQVPETIVRKNRFNANGVRAMVLGTATEFHSHSGLFERNRLKDVAVCNYIAQQEQNSTDNTTIRDNRGTCTTLFVSFWVGGGDTRTSNDTVIKGNVIKQKKYPTGEQQAEAGLSVRAEGLKFISFISSDGVTGNVLQSNNIDISGNSFIHTQVDAESTLMYLFCAPPENITITQNNLKVASLLNGKLGIDKGTKLLTIKGNEIDLQYLSNVASLIYLRGTRIDNCIFDLSDINYSIYRSLNIPLIIFDLSTTFSSTNTIIEGKGSYPTYSSTNYPLSFFSGGNSNKVSAIVSSNIEVPVAGAGAVLLKCPVDKFDLNRKAELLEFGSQLEATLVLPPFLHKRLIDGSFKALGYTSTSIASAVNIPATLYVTPQ